MFLQPPFLLSPVPWRLRAIRGRSNDAPLEDQESTQYPKKNISEPVQWFGATSEEISHCNPQRN